MRSEYQEMFRRAWDREKTKALAAGAMKEGKPPLKMRVYFVGPSLLAMTAILKKAQKYWEQAQAKKGDTRTYVSKLATEAKAIAKANKVILGWIELSDRVIRTSEGHPSLRFDTTGKDIHYLGGTADVIRDIGAEEHIKISGAVTHKNPITNHAEVLMKQYLVSAWGHGGKHGFYEFVTQDHAGPQKIVERTLNKHKRAYDAARDITVAKPPKRVKRANTGSLVVPSIKAEGGEMRHEVVTAQEHMRTWLRSDGSFRKPTESVDQRSLFDMPADKNVTPIVEVPGYKAVFGIHLDHPLVTPGLASQTWW
jgi:hypothetical protein